MCIVAVCCGSLCQEWDYLAHECYICTLLEKLFGFLGACITYLTCNHINLPWEIRRLNRGLDECARKFSALMIERQL